MPVLVKLEYYGEGILYVHGNAVLVAGSPLGRSGHYTDCFCVKYRIHALEDGYILDISLFGYGELKDDLAAYLAPLFLQPTTTIAATAIRR